MSAPPVLDPVAAASACPTCGESFVPGDRFCETCGATLTGGGGAAGAAVTGSAAAGPDPAQTPAAAPTVCPCGDGVADADGYCSSCGRLVPAAADHTESDLGPVGALVSDRGLRHSRNEDFGWLQHGAGGNSGGTPGGTPGGIVVAVVADGVSSSHDPQKA